jgi:Ni/Fe-hydrogenase subunit HybB-like protein
MEKDKETNAMVAAFMRTGKKLLTPFNLVTGVILLAGLVVTVLRFTGGLGAVTRLDDNNPWGIWIGFDLLCGVALAAGGYITSAPVTSSGSSATIRRCVRPS